MGYEYIKQFARDEDGAVTVDWVVLTASIVGLGLAVIVAIAGGVNDVVVAVETDLNQADNFAETVTNAFNGN
jgi:Flp pilus assembly pilin Flp